MQTTVLDLMLRGDIEMSPTLSDKDAAAYLGHVLRLAKAAPRIRIDNVAEYVVPVFMPYLLKTAPRHKVPDHWRFTFEDIPNVAPPFDVFWMEYQRPSTVWGVSDCDEFNRLHGYDKMPQAERPSFGWPVWSNRVGILFLSYRDGEYPALPGIDKAPEGGWSMRAIVFSQEVEREKVWGPITYHFDVDADGSLATWAIALGGSEWNSQAEKIERQIALERGDTIIPALFAISLMHCRNVETQDEEPIPPKVAKAYRKRHGEPKVTFKVLAIDPMRKVLRDAGVTSGGGRSSAKALHLVRGHFKHFDERPLFGKHRGTFWWPQTVRGSVDAGMVVKDYKVLAPTLDTGV